MFVLALLQPIPEKEQLKGRITYVGSQFEGTGKIWYPEQQ